MNCLEYIASMKPRYQVVKCLSDKNGAKVLKMRNTELSRDLVLRQYAKPVLAYEQLKSVQHRNIPMIYDTFALEDGQIVLEEAIDGITVAEVLECGKYSYRGMRRIVKQVCMAVDALHSIGIIHKDIKPENVMITNDGVVKLIDFNASKPVAVNQRPDTVLLGTIGYAPPEQLGIARCDTRTDIYAIGVLINVMLTGDHPSCRLAKGRAGKIVLKCTQIDPESRYQTLEKLMNAL